MSNLYITLCQLRLVQFSRQIMTINPQQGCVVLQRSVESHKNDKHALLSWIMKALPCSSNAGHCVCLTLTGVRRGSSPALATLWYDGLHYSIHFGLQAEHILKRCTGHGWSCSSILIPSRWILRFRTSQLFFKETRNRHSTADLGGVPLAKRMNMWITRISYPDANNLVRSH